jgi:hypothetical protein
MYRRGGVIMHRVPDDMQAVRFAKSNVVQDENTALAVLLTGKRIKLKN